MKNEVDILKDLTNMQQPMCVDGFFYNTLSLNEAAIIKFAVIGTNTVKGRDLWKALKKQQVLYNQSMIFWTK